MLTKMRSEVVAVAVLCAILSASADKIHDLFSANRDIIIEQGIIEKEGYLFVFGESGCSQTGGTASGYSKAALNAMSRVFDRNMRSAEWPADATEAEKNEAWANLRMGKCEQLELAGMQRIWTEKTSNGICRVVLAVESKRLDALPQPSKEELATAIMRLRERESPESVHSSPENAAEQSSQTNSPAFRIVEMLDAEMML